MPRETGASFRVGVGYDSHRFSAGRALKLGGGSIQSDVGLVGHSDADAVCHALTDAILGAAGLGDIGEMVPDTDEANRDRDSIDMLKAAGKRIRDAGFAVNQVDVAVIAEAPRLGPHRERIRARLAGALGIHSESGRVEAKPNEGMGWIGRKEGIACIAIATLTKTS